MRTKSVAQLENIEYKCYLFLLLLCLLSLSLLSELDSDSDPDSDPDCKEDDPPSLPDSSESVTCFCCSIIMRGMFFKCSRRLSVIPPRPIDVKKLMANLVFFGWSLGNIESNESFMVGSLRRSLSRRMPRCSDNSCNQNVWVCWNLRLWIKRKNDKSISHGGMSLYLEKNFNKNSRWRSSVILCQSDVC